MKPRGYQRTDFDLWKSKIGILGCEYHVALRSQLAPG